MSNALAIGAVTAVIKKVLENTLAAQNAIPSVNVTAIPPDRVVPSNPANNTDDDQLNIFLYQVTPNAAWRNAGFPSRDARGERLTNPPLALNLHYFVTAYGQKPFHAEIILGHAMLALQEASVLSREQIRKSLISVAPQGLSDCRLDEQIEQIKINQEILGPEEISKLWSAMTAHYRPTAAYQVSVVLIESEQSTRAPLPVRSIGTYGIRLGPPLIDAVESALGSRAPILAGSQLHILGHNLLGGRVQIRIGEQLLPIQPGPADIAEDRIVCQLPNPMPAGLFAGIQSLRVEHLIDISQPPTPHQGVTSNVQPFVLRPLIAAMPEGVVNSNSTGAELRSGQMKIDFVPDVGRRQSVSFILNQINPAPGKSPSSYTFIAPTDNGISDPAQDTTATVTIPFSGVEAGVYLIRARVDGAESVLSPDASGLYASPTVDLT